MYALKMSFKNCSSILPLVVFWNYLLQGKNSSSSAFLSNSIGFLMMSHHLELCNYVCSDCGQVADSHLSPGYCSQNSKLDRKMIELLDTAVIFLSYFLS